MKFSFDDGTVSCHWMKGNEDKDDLKTLPMTIFDSITRSQKVILQDYT